MTSPSQTGNTVGHRPPIRRLVLASMLGNALEWYDFFLYGFAAPLVFNKLFFPAGTDPIIGTLGAFAGFALGFLARPIGGIVFAHFGDRYGRKNVLLATLVLMGAMTFLMGLLPTYAQIGIWAPVLLVVLRVFQGIATGGEWGGAVLIVTENASQRRQGFYSSFGQAGLSAGFILASAAFLSVQTWLPSQFTTWGWRIPFLLSVIVFAVGLWLRFRIPESAEFTKLRDRAREQKLPVLQTLRTQPKQVLTAMGLRVAENGGSYIFVTFSLAYASFAKLDAGTVQLALIISFLVQLPILVFFGWLSDLIGVWPIYFAGAFGMGLFAFPFFGLLDTGNGVAIFLAFFGANSLSFAAMNAVQPKLFSGLFDTGVRYSGLALGHEVSSAFSGGLSPLIATALLAAYGASWPVALYLILLAAVAVGTLLIVRPSRTRRAAPEAAV
ncbi:MFS transporter [Amycolatopsis sp. NPDC051903]|uniref:MFS transporter n=1 Tax=Amycolatopsis sp. NPDC051903 TaxID=3363936 RepID=UPI0037ABBBC3